MELEVQLAEVKKVLRQQKEGVADLVRELEEKGRDICGRKCCYHPSFREVSLRGGGEGGYARTGKNRENWACRKGI